MSVNWTADQQKAIQTRDCNLLVSAAAGSGKTAVLVERIIQKIISGTDVDRLLVTTFTNAAASKMRLQIGEAITKRLCDNPSNRHLQRQLTLLNRASICTIHSFCLDVVRENFYILDIDPNFSLADPNEVILMKDQAAQETFFELYEQGEEWFLDLADTYGTQRGDERLEALLLRVHEFVKTMPFFERWLKDKVDMFEADMDFDSNIWVRTIKDSAALTLEGCIAMTKDALAVVRENDLDSYEPALHSDLSGLMRLKDAIYGSWNEIVDAFDAFDFDKLKRARKADLPAVEHVKKLRDTVKEQIRFLKNKIFNAHHDILCQDLKRVAPRIRALGRLVSAFDEKYNQIKKQRGVLDFDDLEYLCLRVLSDEGPDGQIRPSEVALLLRERYEEILIDEYQDSNELQETIFSLISRGDNLFMVGDLKQSIYRFRHTNPMLFKQKQDTYLQDAGKNRKVMMSKNFRSRKNILDAVNFIFRQISSPLIGEMEYGEDERLYAGADYPPCPDAAVGGKVEVCIVGQTLDGVNGEPSAADTDGVFDDTGGQERQEDSQESVASAEAEAMQVAKYIQKMIAEPFMVYDKKCGYRPVTYRDIVILMRATTGNADVFVQVLQNSGIPVFADTGSGYFMTQEVMTVLSLLEIIDNPMQDIPLLSVLRSPIANFNDEELLRMRMCNSSGMIYDALAMCAQGSDSLAQKCQKFLERLKKWRSWARYMPTHELIWHLYTDTSYYSFAGAMAGGEQRQANLRLLYERARQYEKTSFRGLFNFISYISRMRRSSADFGSAKLLGENQDLVRIMSIHKSKGLEFPVVFVCGLGKGFNFRDTSEAVLLHKELGFGPDYKDNEARFVYPTIAKLAIKQKLKYESLSEELRLLYVALTRAREKLILTMYIKDIEKELGKWRHIANSAGSERLPVYRVATAACFADWVMPSVMRCENCGIKGAESRLSLPAEFEVKIEQAGGAACHDVSEGKIADILEGEFKELVKERLEWHYPHSGAIKIPTKISVTELKRIYNFELDADAAALYDIELAPAPEFMQESRKLSAAERGSVVHFVMQHLDLSRTLDAEDIASQIHLMQKRELLTPQQVQAVDPNKIAEFFNTDLGSRMRASRYVVREMPFEIEIKASEVYAAAPTGELLLLQGMIDCYFEEDGKLVLVDYKTDFVHNKTEDIESLASKYRPQLEYYARALEKMTSKKVKEKNLYFFSVGRVVKYT